MPLGSTVYAVARCPVRVQGGEFLHTGLALSGPLVVAVVLAVLIARFIDAELTVRRGLVEAARTIFGIAGNGANA